MDQGRVSAAQLTSQEGEGTGKASVLVPSGGLNRHLMNSLSGGWKAKMEAQRVWGLVGARVLAHRRQLLAMSSRVGGAASSVGSH